MANYEISATLNIDNAKAKKAIKDTLTQIKDLEKGTKSYNNTSDKVNKGNDKVTKSTDKLSRAVKDNNRAYKDLFKSSESNSKQIEKLTAGLGDNHKENGKLINDIEKTHKSLIKQNASVEKATKTWQEFGKQRGLAFRGGSLVSSSNSLGLTKDFTKNLGIIKNRTSQIGNISEKAFSDYANRIAELNTKLNKGTLEQSNFHKGIRDIGNYMKGTYGVTVRQLGNGYSELKSKTSSVGDALDRYNNILKRNNSLIRRGQLTQANRLEAINARDSLGRMVLGAERYNKLVPLNIDKTKEVPNTWKAINAELSTNQKLYGQLNGKVRTTNNLINTQNNHLDLLGGKYSSIANKTGNYNKLLTTTTRSQRMQNYAMQVAGLRYNALGTTVGFVGGMLGTQLVMGFASARIEAVKFEQQAQQMFKTSKLNKKSIENVTKAVKEYARENRKINTQGLEYTVAQVTKLNNLSEEQAKKIIPVVADITNMMRINGRSQEDSILAVNDALDGQFKRLQEIGVGGKNALKAYGWNGNVDDKMSLIGALEKVGKKKGWNDLTKDISTLDDAYNALGNTIDDVITPVMTNLTPIIVKTVQAFSGLVSKLWEAPMAVKGVATALAVLGTAFGRMKLEMLYARLIGSEFIARLTGLDAGMNGITRSVGAVQVAVREGAISFEEGTRCLMDYHTAQIGAYKSFRQYNEELTALSAEQRAYNIELEYMKANEAEYTAEQIAATDAKLADTIATRSQLEAQRKLDVEYARYILANKNLSASGRLQLDALKKRFGLSKAEATHIAMKTGAIDAETGAIDVNTIAKKLGVDMDKMSNIERKKYIARSQLQTLGIARESKALENKARVLYGLVPSQKMYNKALTDEFGKQGVNNIVNNTAKKIYSQLSVEQRKLTSLKEIETFVTGALNDVEAENVDITSLQALAKNKLSDEQLLNNKLLEEGSVAQAIENRAMKASNESIAINTTEKRMNGSTTKRWIKDTLASAKASAKQAGATALMTAEYLAFTPQGWAVTLALGAITIAMSRYISKIKELNSSYDKFYKIQEELPDKLDKLKNKQKELEESNKNGKNDKEIANIKEKIKYYQKLYDKVNKVVEARTKLEEQTEMDLGNQGKKFLNRINRKYGKKEEDYTGVEEAISDTQKQNKRMEKLTKEAEKNEAHLDYVMAKNHLGFKKSKEYAKEYVETYNDMFKSIQDQNSEDFLTRLSGKWGEVLAQWNLDWIDFKASLPSTISSITDTIGDLLPKLITPTNLLDILLNPTEDRNNPEKNRKALSDWITNIYKSISSIDINEIFQENIGKPFREWWNSWSLIDMILPEPVSAEGNEGTPLLDRIKHDLGLDKLGEWVTNDVEPKFRQLGDTINYWLDINNWLQLVEGGEDFITEWWDTNIVLPFQTLTTNLGTNLHKWGSSAGNKLKSGIKQGMGKLVEPVASKVQEIVTYLTSGQAITDAKNKAKDFAKGIYDGFKNGLGDPSKIITDEVKEIVKAITDKIDEVKKKAQELGEAVPKGVTDGTLHRSPGLAAKIVLAEMEYIYGFIENYVPKIQSISEKAGQAIPNGMNKNNISGNLNIVQNNQDIIKSNNLASKNTVAQYGTMSDTVDQSFTEMSDNATTDMQTVANQNAQYLGKMNNDTKTHMTNINTTTTSKLHTMQSTTATATNAMTKAWGSMRSSIVNSASQIREQSYSKFNSLHKSIASFYRQIQSAKFNAGALVAGSPSRSVKFSTTKHSTNSGVAGYSRQADREYVKLLNGLSNHSATNEDVIKFYSKYPMKCIGDDCFAGMTQNHVNRQINYASKWKISDPKMYGIALPMNNTVGDFNNGNRPRITYGNFEEYLGALLNARGFRGTYQFYFNSKRSNQQVWDDVRCNCFDGAELIMEIARDMGLGDVSMVHGSYNGIRHVAAKVGGKIYDMTQFQNRGVFRGVQGVSFGGAGYQGRSIKWSPNNRYAGNTTNTTNNKRVNKVEVVITGNTFIGDKDFRNQMKDVAEDVFYDKMSDNPCIGY